MQELKERELPTYLEKHLAVCRMNAQGLITHWTIGAEKLLGYQSGQMLGQNFTDLFSGLNNPPPNLLEMAEMLGKASFQVQCRCKDGHLVETDVTILPETSKAGNLIGFSMVLWDIGKQKIMENRLRASEELFSSTFHQAAVGIVHVRMSDGRFLRANQKACEMLGYTEEEYCQKTIQEVTHPDDVQSDLENTIKMIRGEIEMFAMEKRLMKKDGTPIWTKLTAASVARDAMGQATYGMAVVEDIGHIKEAEQALQESEERFRLMADAAPVLIFVTDAQPKNTYVNKRYLDYTGLSLEDALGYKWQYAIHPDDLEPYLQKFTNAFNQRKSFNAEIRARRKNGRYGWILVTADPRYTPNGMFAGYIGTGVDITQRKEGEQTLERAKLHAEEVNLRKSEFLAMMSHELRTPLNSIIGYASMIEHGMGGPLTERQNKYIHNVTLSGHHLLNIINDILDISKVEAGKMEISLTRFRVGPLLQEIKDIMRNISNKKNVEVDIQIAENLTIIEADLDRFKQVLINLINNAIKFNHVGGQVWVRLFKSDDGNWVIGQVIDTGIGIPQDKLDNLFSKFYQVDSSTSRPQEGTGLGLALTKELVELHGGEISVESTEGIGSTFTFTLPHHEFAFSH